MSVRATPACLFIALAMTLSWPTLAQAPLTAVERAQREAERVFEVIKFHTVRNKPAVDPGNKKERPAPPRPARPAPATADGAPTAPEAAASAAALPAVERSANPLAGEAAAPTAAAAPAPTSTPEASPPEAAALPEADEPDEVPLRLQSFVAPVVTPALQATMGAGSRQVRVRLTVQADGRVSHAEAAAGVPRRLAKPAVDAILQWQFAPLPEARTAEVEITFRRD